MAKKYVLKRKDGPHLILHALAGTGKTFSQVEAANRLVTRKPSKGVRGTTEQEVYWDACLSGSKPQEIVAVAFNKSIADTLKARMPQSVESKTMHSLGYRALADATGVRKFNLTDYKCDEILEGVLRLGKGKIREFKRDNLVLVNTIRKLTALVRQNMLGFEGDAYEAITKEYGEQFTVYPFDVGGVTWEAIEGLIAHHDMEIAERDVQRTIELTLSVMHGWLDVPDDLIDFTDMIWLPQAKGYPIKKYDVLLGDEVQDWNRCQQALARKSGWRLLLCGDPHQAIYGFAGADSESMQRMYTDLSQDKQGCLTFPLTMTRRCGKKIVEEAAKLVPKFTAFEENEVGEVVRVRDDVLWNTTKAISKETPEEYAKRIVEWSKSEEMRMGVIAGDMIVCRMNAPLVAACFRLLRMGVKATIQGRDFGKQLVTLIETIAGKGSTSNSVDDLVEKIEKWYARETEKLEKKKFASEAQRIALEEKYECLLEFCRQDDLKTVGDVVQRVETIFADEELGPDGHSRPKGKVLLSSVHRAKGLEADRVFIITPEKMPHPMATQPWQVQQEMNLKYVAITRAISTLVWVETSPKE